VRAEQPRDRRIQISDVIGQQAAIVRQHRDTVPLGDFGGKRERFLVRRNRRVARGQPVVAADRVVQ
jgi:hypothetical protein